MALCRRWATSDGCSNATPTSWQAFNPLAAQPVAVTGLDWGPASDPALNGDSGGGFS
jgi:hypothetical protein